MRELIHCPKCHANEANPASQLATSGEHAQPLPAAWCAGWVRSVLSCFIFAGIFLVVWAVTRRDALLIGLLLIGVPLTLLLIAAFCAVPLRGQDPLSSTTRTIADFRGWIPYGRLNSQREHPVEMAEAVRASTSTRLSRADHYTPAVVNGAFSADLFLCLRRTEQAFVLALLELVACGAASTKVRGIIPETYRTEIPRHTIAALCERLDASIGTWNNRDLSSTVYPFLVVTAVALKVREDMPLCSSSALIATGINAEGYHEVLGTQIGDAESEASWSRFFGWLSAHGVHGVDVVVSCPHGGLVRALQTHFKSITWQHCQAHLTRKIRDATPKDLHSELIAQLRTLFMAADSTDAQVLLQMLLDRYHGHAPMAMGILEAGFNQTMTVLALPPQYRSCLRSTVTHNRFSVELRRRESEIGIFPSRQSVLRMAGAMLMEMQEKWPSGRQKVQMDTYWRSKRAHLGPMPQASGAA